ncbi:hypothetical protein Taro_002079 [Colocasia esculenta]|uniref:Uncharacterized protein n=1 Tax=Colocasia esculenta TaxID=4460 RepID=A0A843TGB0_COLES|nr:hypothetical protein [Colocasia esculenta]
MDPPFSLHLELGLCSCTDRNLASRPLVAKISSLRPAILPSNSLNGQRPSLSSSGQNNELFFLIYDYFRCLVGDTPLEETVESDSEHGE